MLLEQITKIYGTPSSYKDCEFPIPYGLVHTYEYFWLKRAKLLDRTAEDEVQE